MAAQDDVQTSTVAIVGFLGAILVFAVILLLTVIYYRVASRQDYAKRISQPYVELENVLAEQQAKLVEYRWVDREKRVVAIPIDRAMELVVQELSSGNSPKVPEVDRSAAGRGEAPPQPDGGGEP